MAQVIRHGRIERLPEGERLVPLASWNGEPGVLLAAGDDPAALEGRLESLDVIAIDFPQFTDGRGYSSARLLRERYRYTREIRAVGDVVRDSLHYLSRCGFDAFVLSSQENLAAALESLCDFSEAYQNSVERPEPLFRRRAA